MPKLKCFFSLIFLVLALTLPRTSFAWGERGHHTICEVATQIIKDPELSSFMKSKSHMMGHTCNVPDIYWRDLGEVAKSGDATHFMNPENLGYSLATVPTDLRQIMGEKQGQFSPVLKRNIDVVEDLGSSWWRYDQFYRRAVTDGKLAAEIEAKIQASVKGDPNIKDLKEKYNQAVFSMMTNMGLMGHFIGDAAQPYHNTTDYDGWDLNHGGIHGFYETKIVNELSLSLPHDVFKMTQSLRQKQGAVPATALDKIRAVGLAAIQDLPRIRALDVILEPSKVVTNPDGSVTRTPAKRKNPEDVAKNFKTVIVKELALAALSLSETWDQIYIEAGKPSFRMYNSYKYPLEPDFVSPDYDSRQPNSVKDKKKNPSPFADHQD